MQERVCRIAKGVNVFAQVQATRIIANISKVAEFKLQIVDWALIPLINLAQFGNRVLIVNALIAIGNISELENIQTPEDSVFEEIEETHWRFVLNASFKVLCQRLLKDESFKLFLDCAVRKKKK